MGDWLLFTQMYIGEASLRSNNLSISGGQLKAMASQNTLNGAVGLPGGCVPAGWTPWHSAPSTQHNLLLCCCQANTLELWRSLVCLIGYCWTQCQSSPMMIRLTKSPVDQYRPLLLRMQQFWHSHHSLRTGTVAADGRPPAGQSKPKEKLRLQHW